MAINIDKFNTSVEITENTKISETDDKMIQILDDAKIWLESQTQNAVNQMSNEIENIDTTIFTARDESLESATAALTSEQNAEQSAISSNQSKNKAHAWAEADEDIEVEAGEYSAKHWAKKAAKFGINSADSVSTNSSNNTLAGENVQANIDELDNKIKSVDENFIKKEEGQVKDNLTFTGDITFAGTVTDKTEFYKLGQPGEIGFGVATAQASWYVEVGAVPLNGHDIKTSPNYGNYMHIASGAILVCIPKHYYKIDGNNFSYSDTQKDGYVIDRSFLNGDGLGGVNEADCVFISKYGLTKNGNIASAQQGKDPLSTHSNHNPISALDGIISNNYGGLYKAVKTLDKNAFLTPIFHYSMLARMSIAQGQASTSLNTCAFIDVEPKQPKGNLNNALSDVNDTSVTFTASGYSNCALTGSGIPFAKTTHNGQESGVADLTGNMWEVASAFIRTNSNGFMILKDTTDIRTIIDDSVSQAGAYNTDLYDEIDISDLVNSNGGWTYFGNGTNQVFGFSADTSSAIYRRTSIGVPLATGVSSAGTTKFGNDGFYRYLRNEMACLSGGGWGNPSYAGPLCMGLDVYRTNSNDSVGGRASFIVHSSEAVA